jgi:hypothetical protein
MSYERKSFQPSIQSDNEIYLHNGKEIFFALKDKFPIDGEKCQENCDIILNSLCASLICLLHSAVDKDNRKQIIQLIHKILSQNV